MKKILVPLPFLVGLFALSAMAQQAEHSPDPDLVKFRGGIGVIPVASGVGPGPTAEVVNLNFVRGVPPTRRPDLAVISPLSTRT